jgi:hypothetical protein
MTWEYVLKKEHVFSSFSSISSNFWSVVSAPACDASVISNAMSLVRMELILRDTECLINRRVVSR